MFLQGNAMHFWCERVAGGLNTGRETSDRVRRPPSVAYFAFRDVRYNEMKA
jgi:hypothetical protein